MNPVFQPTRLPGRDARPQAQSAPPPGAPPSDKATPALGVSIRGNPVLASAASVRDNPTPLKPGQPHTYAVRTNREAGRLEYTICRCQNPNSHGDAFSPDAGTLWYEDNIGDIISWNTLMTRILYLYGKDSMSRQEEIEMYPRVLSRFTAIDLIEESEYQDWCVAQGAEFVATREAQWHNEDGHRKGFVSDEGGMKTVAQRPNYWHHRGEAGPLTLGSGSHPPPEDLPPRPVTRVQYQHPHTVRDGSYYSGFRNTGSTPDRVSYPRTCIPNYLNLYRD